MAVNTTFDFDQMLSNAREAYGEELLRMADDGLDFVFTYSDNVAPSSSAGKLIAKYDAGDEFLPIPNTQLVLSKGVYVQSWPFK